MSSLEKLRNKIFSNSPITYDEAEKMLLHLGFKLRISGSHHIFSKTGALNNISLKRRKELKQYQIKLLRQVLIEHGYEKK